jgi:hypothetical protein
MTEGGWWVVRRTRDGEKPMLLTAAQGAAVWSEFNRWSPSYIMKFVERDAKRAADSLTPKDGEVIEAVSLAEAWDDL